MELILYEQEDGRSPFKIWLLSLRDKMAHSRILARLRQIEAGNMGDCAPVGEGVLECAFTLELATGCIAAAPEPIGSSCCPAETRPAKQRKLPEPKRSGQIGNGGYHEKVCRRRVA